MYIETKDYLEEYARHILAYKLGFNIDNLLHKDKPDIQNFVDQIGIEVVEDTYAEEKELARFWIEYEKVSYDKIPPRKIDGYYKRNGKLQIADNKLIGGSLGKSKANSPEHLMETIEKKLKKLNDGIYENFDSYMLYVFTDTVSLFGSYVQSVIEYICSADYRMKYNKIILDGSFELCYCDITAKTFERYSISNAFHESIDNKVQAVITEAKT